MDYTMIWAIVIVVLIIVEIVTVGLVSIWFAFGALLALIFAFFGTHFALQIAAFLLGSFVSILAIRPLATQWLRIGKERTNADQVIGQNAIVMAEIDNDNGTGLVKIAGQTWSARSESFEKIPVGEEVVVLRISGVKVFVKRTDEMI